MRYGSKDTTAEYTSIDVRRWHRKGLLAAGQSFTWEWSQNGKAFAWMQVRSTGNAVVLSYRYRRSGEEWRDVSYPVALDWTRCNYGGERPWFICPARGCGRRVAILYNGGIFACRHCYQLAYESQREAAYERALDRAQSIRVRLGGSPNMSLPFPDKPKGMHWRTYQRLQAQEQAAAARSWPDWLLRNIR